MHADKLAGVERVNREFCRRWGGLAGLVDPGQHQTVAYILK